MQQFPNYSQMNNPYAQTNNMYSQTNNPYLDRMNFLQNYQQSLQQPVAGTQMSLPNQQMNLVGKMVDSIDVVKATDIPMDGNMYFFPKADGSEIFGKQWLQNGTTRILTFKPVLDVEPNALSSTEEKFKIDLSEEATEGIMKRFDELETKISSLTKSLTKTSKARVSQEQKQNKEGVDNE